ncbi:thioredoxin family protein, partial [Mariniblastus sp.]|nr:thioredoxin family protein [Mariniblastus sp.]
PIANQIVSFSSEYHFEWKEDGQLESGNDSLQWWAVTDQNGIASTIAAPGDFSIYIYNPDWRPSREFKIKKGKPARLEFHRESAGKRMIRGQLYLDSGDTRDLTGTVVELKSVDGEIKSEETVTTDKAGKFTCEMDGSRIGGYAKTADGKLTASFFISDFKDGAKKIPLDSGIQYRGKLVDVNDEPIKDMKLQMKVILKEKESDRIASRFFRSQFDIDTLSKTTDENGFFEFQVPPNMPCRLFYQKSPATQFDRFGTRFFIPGEKRPLEVIKIGKNPAPKYSAKETVARKANDCRLNNMRQLFVFEGKGDSVSKFLQPVLLEDGKKNRSLYWYSIKRLDSREWSVPESRNFWESYVSEFPAENEVAFLVLGSEAETINSLTVNASDAESVAKVAEFVEANRTADINAQDILDDALSLAESTERKVWLQFSQTRCGPCFRLSRWIDKHKNVLEKAYVFIKVDDLRDKNGRKIWKKYVGKRSMGIPFCVVLDENGIALEKSLDDQGSNIGFPSAFEDRRGFRRIFNATAKEQLSQEEIDALVKSME